MAKIEVRTWREAELEVERLADGLPIYWGSGYAIERPHVLAVALDALSGAGMGYNVTVFPEGERYGKSRDYHVVRIVR